VREALEAYGLPTLDASIVQRVVFAEAAAVGRAVYEQDRDGVASQEIEQVIAELQERFA
jgi:chromosome partitioning protein